MKINRPASALVPALATLSLFTLALVSCSGAPPQPAPAPHAPAAPAPRPTYPPPAPRPVPLPAPVPRSDAANWRDLPQTPGVWIYSADATGSTARFGQPGAAPLVTLRCDRSRPAVVFLRAGLGAGEVPATIATSTAQRRLSARPDGAPGLVQNAAIPFEIALAVRDPLLDAIAFSRGRFMLEMGGAQTLILPVWSELGRVIEDCR